MTYQAYQNLLEQAHRVAGAPHALLQRVRAYQAMYRDSGGRNVFALIAGHGTLWAVGYFQYGTQAARSLAMLQSPWRAARRQALRATMEDFAQRFRVINQQVFVQAYAAYHYTQQFGAEGMIRALIGDRLSDCLMQCHAAQAAGEGWSKAQCKALFHAYFEWEQDRVVHGAVEEAYAALDWPLVKALSRWPVVRFRYFKWHQLLRFSDFARKDARIEQGLQAYAWGDVLGWDQVDAALEEGLALKERRTPPQAPGATAY